MRTYRAAPSQGAIWIWGMTAVGAALVAVTWLVGMFWLALILAPFVLFSALIAMWLPSMRYELGPEELVARCGALRYIIPLREIQSVSRRDFVLNPLSSVRGPGYALFRVPYADQGVVTMCATRSLKDIILIVTSRRKYGITPHHMEEFLGELTRLLGRG